MTCDTLGLYARSVEDLELLAKVFQLADDEPIPETRFETKGAKIGFCRSPVWKKAGPETRWAFERARELLGKEGAIAEELELPEDFTKIREWHGNVLAGEGRTSFLGCEFSLRLIRGLVLMSRYRLFDWEGEYKQEHREPC